MTLAFIERLAILLPDENADPEGEVQAEHSGPASSDPDCSNRLLARSRPEMAYWGSGAERNEAVQARYTLVWPGDS